VSDEQFLSRRGIYHLNGTGYDMGMSGDCMTHAWNMWFAVRAVMSHS
jgi:hypothetical protein